MSQNKSLSVSSIAKIILSGEHSVVYGEPAIALPIFSCKSTATLLENNLKSNFIEINAPQIDLCEKISFNYLNSEKNLSPLKTTVINFLKDNQVKLNNSFSIKIHSDIPIASGMGSGASISASIIKLLAKYFTISLDKKTLFDQIMKIEKIYHGNPSGIDPTIIVEESPCYYIKGEKLESINSINENYSLVIINSNKKVSTKDVVNSLKRNLEQFPHKSKLIQKIGVLTKEIKLNWLNHNYPKVGALMNDNQILLKSLNLSSEVLDNIISICNLSGSLGTKLSGAGWGGIVVSLVESNKLDLFVNSVVSKGIDKKLILF